MNIGEAAERSGLPTKTLRYYEDIGLLEPGRGPNGYRRYSEADVHRLAFLGRARSLGFSIQEVRALVGLYDDRGRASADVKALARAHRDRIDRKIVELEALRTTLDRLIESCAGDTRPDCPILEDLAGSGAAAGAKTTRG